MPFAEPMIAFVLLCFLGLALTGRASGDYA